MARQDNKSVINVTGKNKTNKQKNMFLLARLVTQASWVAVFSPRPGADIFSSLAMLICQCSRHTGNQLKRCNRKSGGQHSQRAVPGARSSDTDKADYYVNCPLLTCFYKRVWHSACSNWFGRTGGKCSAVREYEIRRKAATCLKLTFS